MEVDKQQPYRLPVPLVGSSEAFALIWGGIPSMSLNPLCPQGASVARLGPDDEFLVLTAALGDIVLSLTRAFRLKQDIRPILGHYLNTSNVSEI